MESASIILIPMLVGGLIGFAIGMVPYVFNSLGLYRIMQGRGTPNPWMAWVPVANYYALGAVSDDINLRARGKSTHLRIWLLVLGLAAVAGSVGFLLCYVDLIVSMITANNTPYYDYSYDLAFTLGPMGGIILFYLFLMAVSVAYTVFYGIAIYRLFQDYCPQNAVLYTVLSLVISLCAPFLIFSVRNNTPVSFYGQPQAGPYGMPPQYAPYYQGYGQQPPYPPYNQPPAGGPSNMPPSPPCPPEQ